MKILVLGGNGFIGSHLVDKLLLKGHYVRVFDKNKEYYREEIPNVDYYYGKFGNRELLVEALKDIDIVVHLISTTNPKISNENPEFDVKSNVIETLFLLDKCVEKNIKKVVFTSSGGTIYGIPEFIPVVEDNQTNPICSYGISKLTIEKYLFLYKELYNLDYVIIRPSNPFGSRQNPYGIQGVIPIFLGKILKDEPIEIWGDGEIVRDYIFVEDLIEGIYCSIINKSASKIFNIGSGKGYSLNDIVAIMRKVTNQNISVLYKDSRNYDVPKIYLDIKRGIKELNWKPIRSMEYGVEKTWEFIKGIDN